MDVDGILSGYYLVDSRTALLLLATLLCGSHLNSGDKGVLNRVGPARANSSLPDRGSRSRPLGAFVGRSLAGVRNPSFRESQASQSTAQASTPTAQASDLCPRPGNPCDPALLSHSPSQATKALKPKADSRSLERGVLLQFRRDPVVQVNTIADKDGPRFLSSTPTPRTHYDGPRLKRKSARDCGRRKAGLQVQLPGRLAAGRGRKREVEL